MEIKVSAKDQDLLKLRWTRDRGAKKGTPNELWYAVRKSPDGKRYRMHRVIMSRMLGRELSREEHVDHINYDGLDNRRENLQILTSAENTRRRRMNCNNTSGVRGVKHRHGSWHASICYKRHVISIGTYAKKDDAIIAHQAVLEFVTKLDQKITSQLLSTEKPKRSPTTLP